MNKVVILSGGMDSSTVLYDTIVDTGVENVFALTFNYGQRHSKEIDAARKVAQYFEVAHTVHNVSVLRAILSGSALTDNVEVPHGHYAEENMKATVVPNRNMILLSLAIGKAISIGADTVVYGAHAGDHAIYPDCRPAFVETMKAAAMLCHFHPIKIEAPFLGITKAEILARGKNRVPYHLTWTCYEGKAAACGRCGSCVERLEAFHINGMEDPLPYADREFWKAQLERKSDG